MKIIAIKFGFEMKSNLPVTSMLALLTTGIVAQTTSAEQAQSGEMEEIVVTGKQLPYMRLTETATKTKADLFDTPLSVTILNETFLQDLVAETLADAYPYTLGLSQSGTNANNFTLRGLPSDLQNVQIDGLPGLASRFGSPTTANIERVEVLKGPASVLYGLMEPGGLINIITQKPSAERKTSVDLSMQSYAGDVSSFGDDLGATLSVNTSGAIDADEKWLYRVVANVENIDSFRNGVNYQNVHFFPSASYQFSDKLLATFGLEYVVEKGDADNGLVAVNNDIDLVADADVRYQRDGDFDDDEGAVIFARLNYDLDENTQLNLNYRSVFHKDERKLFENNRVNDASDPLLSTLRRRDRHQLNRREYHFVDANLNHSLEAGGMRHNILVGLNGGLERSDFERLRFGAAVTPNVDVFNPLSDEGAPSAISSGTDRVTDLTNFGLYAQDVIDFSDEFSVMIGARFDQQDVDFVEQNSNFKDSQTSRAFLPQGGIVYKPSEFLSIYGSYTESFSPNSVERRSATGGSFDPEEGRQYEAGVKLALLNERVNITFATFDIEKTNILERNTDGDWDLLGALESRGAEFELQALPLENWQLRLGYAYVDSIISDSPNASLVGARNAFAPVHDAFIWSRYNYPETIFGGTVGFSLGLNYESVRHTNAAKSTRVTLPSYARVDAGLYYQTGDYRLALNVENLNDKQYYTGGSRDTRIYPGKPRLITMSLKVDI